MLRVASLLRCCEEVFCEGGPGLGYPQDSPLEILDTSKYGTWLWACLFCLVLYDLSFVLTRSLRYLRSLYNMVSVTYTNVFEAVAVLRLMFGIEELGI